MNLQIAKSISRNATVMFGSQLVTWISTFVLMLFLPRYLGPSNYGRLFLAMSVAGIFEILIDFEGRIGIAKRIARSRETSAQIIVNSIGFRLIFWGIAFMGMMLFGFISGYPVTVKILMVIFGIEMLWLGCKVVLLGLFSGHEMMTYTSLGAICEKVFISLVGVTALLLGINVVGMAIIMVTGTLLNFFVLSRYAARLIPSIPSIDWKATRDLIKEGTPYLLWTIFGVIYYRIDTVMLSFLTSDNVVGWYGASYRFFDSLAFLPSIYSIAILPILSRLWGRENVMLARLTQKSLEFVIIAGIPLSVIVVAFSGEIIKFFFGIQGFAPSVINLKIFGTGLLLLYIDMVLATTLFACDKQRQWAVVAFFAIFVNVGLNIFMIPSFQAHVGNGGVGAAIATLVTELFVMICAISLIPRDVYKNVDITAQVKAIGSGVIMAGVLWVIHSTGIPWVAQATLGVFIYTVALLSLKTFESEELRFFKDSLRLSSLKGTFATPRDPVV